MWIIWQIKICIWTFLFLVFKIKFLDFLSELLLFQFIFLTKIINIILQSKYDLLNILYSFSQSQFFYFIPEFCLVIFILGIGVFFLFFPKNLINIFGIFS